METKTSLNHEKPPIANVLLGDSALCSGCNTKQGTVDRNMFDGLCADCTNKALYDYEFAKKAQIRNEELKGHFA
jgi:predicted amidophosphoribosyltransferase